ncbi:MAG: YARHG domain-containing protein [Bacteroidales bacterium]|nr:YARHG domain-containing protein [Bacteroidales bacterium]
MKKLFTILFALLAIATAKANDGAFYAEGNHLIPITETDISVKKEILCITRVARPKDSYPRFSFTVNVYYEFYNPGAPKDLLVGFEAPGDGNENGNAYIHNFKVLMNGQSLPHEVARIFYPLKDDGCLDWGNMKGYYKNGHFVKPTKEQLDGLTDEDSPYYPWDADPFYFVYHFNAHFNKGLNIIQHTYDFEGSDLVYMDYLFDYVLTAANRWANNGIDDFTLELDMGERTSFAIHRSFFNDANEWTFTGKGRVGQMLEVDDLFCMSCPVFHVQSGKLVFHKKNFHPEGELSIISGSYCSDAIELVKARYIDFNFNQMPAFSDEQEKRILKNLPFAYRGYVFKDKGLQRFFESTEWYMPNPDYQADMTKFDKGEKQWVQFFGK